MQCSASSGNDSPVEKSSEPSAESSCSTTFDLAFCRVRNVVTGLPTIANPLDADAVAPFAWPVSASARFIETWKPVASIAPLQSRLNSLVSAVTRNVLAKKPNWSSTTKRPATASPVCQKQSIWTPWLLPTKDVGDASKTSIVVIVPKHGTS